MATPQHNITYLLSLSSNSGLLGDLGRLSSSRLGENRLGGLLARIGLLARTGLLALTGLLGLAGLLVRCGLRFLIGLLALSLSLQFGMSLGGVLSLDRYGPGDLDRRLSGLLSLPPAPYPSDCKGLLALSRLGERSRSNLDVSERGERGRAEGR